MCSECWMRLVPYEPHELIDAARQGHYLLKEALGGRLDRFRAAEDTNDLASQFGGEVLRYITRRVEDACLRHKDLQVDKQLLWLISMKVLYITAGMNFHMYYQDRLTPQEALDALMAGFSYTGSQPLEDVIESEYKKQLEFGSLPGVVLWN